jgi:hypothetical protein
VAGERIAGMGWKIWQALFDALPDVSGVLLAAVGVAIVIAPEPIQNLEKRKYVRWILAAALVAMGVAGLWSSFLQRGRDGIEKSELHGDVRDLKIELAKFGPKLDWIISHPQSKSQQSQAIDLKREIAAAIGRPRVELSEPRLTYFKDGRVTFMFPETNTGSTIARGKLNTTDMLVGSNERQVKIDFSISFTAKKILRQQTPQEAIWGAVMSIVPNLRARRRSPQMTGTT